MPSASELARVEEERTIDRKEPIFVTIRRGRLQSRIEIDPLLLDVAQKPEHLIVGPTLAFLEQMQEALRG